MKGFFSCNRFADYGIMLVIEDHRTLNDGRILIKTVGGKRFKVRKKSVVQSFIYKLDFEMSKKFYNQEFF